jgi:hydroxymethylpyrimidine pyrophosphatase-like HAD family hydrolase
MPAPLPSRSGTYNLGVPQTPARLLLALDCDGTLLDPDGQIRPRVRDAVREAAARGALVTLATGRRLAAARHYAAALGLRTPLVLHDGAAVQDPLTGALVYQDPLPQALVVRLVAAILNHGLTLADCVAVGDGENDLELLREVGAAEGIAVAMGQAPPAVRAAAGHTVAGNDADGVAEAVARFVLPRLAPTS